MILTPDKQNQAQMSTIDDHLCLETTDATVHVKTDDTDRARETARTHGEIGAGLEIAVIGIEGTETGMDEGLRTERGVPAETAAMIDEVGTKYGEHNTPHRNSQLTL